MPSAKTTCISTLGQRFLSASSILLVRKFDLLKIKACMRHESTSGGKHLYLFGVSGTCGNEVTVWVIVGQTQAVDWAWPVIFELSHGHNLVCNSLLRSRWRMMSLQRPCHLTSPAVLLLLRRRRQVWQRYWHLPCRCMHLLWGKLDTVIIILHFKVIKFPASFLFLRICL